ncbi:MAG TPA: hypothetical protein VEU97_07750 [Ktedonobacteraceae bacterium]|nr:hypothetical protein [Ktedonobacteraceae bacterium]
MPTPDSHQLVLVRRLERVLLAFFLLALLFLCVVYAAAPSLYTNTLVLKPSPTDRSTRSIIRHFLSCEMKELTQLVGSQFGPMSHAATAILLS